MFVYNRGFMSFGYVYMRSFVIWRGTVRKLHVLYRWMLIRAFTMIYMREINL